MSHQVARFRLTLLACWFALGPTGALAGEGDEANALKFPSDLGHTCPPLWGCPDDYCRKPVPYLHCLPAWCGIDDYCRKPLPYLHCFNPGCELPRYCRKPLPDLCRPLCSPFYQCPPPRVKVDSAVLK